MRARVLVFRPDHLETISLPSGKHQDTAKKKVGRRFNVQLEVDQVQCLPWRGGLEWGRITALYRVSGVYRMSVGLLFYLVFFIGNGP